MKKKPLMDPMGMMKKMGIDMPKKGMPPANMPPKGKGGKKGK